MFRDFYKSLLRENVHVNKFAMILLSVKKNRGR